MRCERDFEPAGSAAASVLMVGDFENMGGAAILGLDGSSLSFATPALLSGPGFARLNPHLVMSPLFGASFDALDIASALSRGAFCGSYLVVTDRLPDPALVAREVARVAPGLRFGILLNQG